MSCLVHDSWRLDERCSCSSERKWARDKMLKETLEKIATNKLQPTEEKK